jgi:hypothetical protein
VRPIREWRDVDAESFHSQVATQYEPAVLRGVVAQWPAVRAAVESPAIFCTYLARRDTGTPVDTLRMPPSAKGRIFYNPALTGFNYDHEKVPLTQVIERIVKYAAMQNPPSVAAQSALLADCAPTFRRGERPAAAGPDHTAADLAGLRGGDPRPLRRVEQRGLRGGGAAAFHAAAAGAGREPLHRPARLRAHGHAHQPGVLPRARLHPLSPASARRWRLRRWRSSAPGDAIYIPPLWWHHVESLERLNALVNYWWKGNPDAPADAPSAITALHLSVKTFEHASPEQRAAWDALFGHFVFKRS